MGSRRDQPPTGARRRTFAGFAAQRAEGGFTIHIIDDAGEVFEIEANRENVELIRNNLELLLSGKSVEDAHESD